MITCTSLTPKMDYSDEAPLHDPVLTTTTRSRLNHPTQFQSSNNNNTPHFRHRVRRLWESPYLGGNLNNLDRTAPQTHNFRHVPSSDIDANAPGYVSAAVGHAKRTRSNDSHEEHTSKLISDKYESLDYDICENVLLEKETHHADYQRILYIGAARWAVMLLIGVVTALIASAIDICIELAAGLKFRVLQSELDTSVQDEGKTFRLVLPYLLWVGINAVPVAITAIITTYYAPVSAGSGIPQIKCYLNGVKIPEVVRLKTLLAKSFGIVCSVVGGLAAGKEGPMVHAGAVVAAGISQGQSSALKIDFGLFTYFRNDNEKRDFVSGGAAAGVSAAFGAPVGGVLFSLEEGASFWNQALVWRIFFASMTSYFTLNLVLSWFHGHPGDLSYSGLVNFGRFANVSFTLVEIPLYMAMGVIGGLLGALFVSMNKKLTVFRMKHVERKWLKVIEAVIVAWASATIAFYLIVFSSDCQPHGADPNVEHQLQLYCSDGFYNGAAAMAFQTPEKSVRSFFHDPRGSFRLLTLLCFAAPYYFLSCWTYGLSVPSGLFIPALLSGAAWGRIIGDGLVSIGFTAIDPGKCALMGAAAHLGGIVRMTISLTVILMEATGDLTLGLPIMLVLIIAQRVGNFFNHGIYDSHIHMSRVPLLEWEPPLLSEVIRATDVMSHPVTTLRCNENVGVIVDILRRETHNGFPVVDDNDPGYGPGSTGGGSAGGGIGGAAGGMPLNCAPVFASYQYQLRGTSAMMGQALRLPGFGRLRGLILRSQLTFLLKNRIFNELPDAAQAKHELSMKDYAKLYPRYFDIDSVVISEADRRYTIDLTPFMNPSVYVVSCHASLPRIFRLFRALGLRHIPVVDDFNQVVGVVTRKDLARYRSFSHMGKLGIHELQISQEKLPVALRETLKKQRQERHRRRQHKRLASLATSAAATAAATVGVGGGDRRRRLSTQPMVPEEDDDDDDDDGTAGGLE